MKAFSARRHGMQEFFGRGISVPIVTSGCARVLSRALCARVLFIWRVRVLFGAAGRAYTRVGVGVRGRVGVGVGAWAWAWAFWARGTSTWQRQVARNRSAGLTYRRQGTGAKPLKSLDFWLLQFVTCGWPGFSGLILPSTSRDAETGPRVPGSFTRRNGCYGHSEA